VVSTITVNKDGGIIMTADNTPWPNTVGSAPIAFNRITGQAATELQMTPSKQVPKFGSPETTYLAAVTNGGTLYDDIAVEGLQIYGNQLTNPNVNNRCAGYLTRKLEDVFSVELRTLTFYTSRISSFIMDADIIRVKNDLIANRAVFSTLTVSTGTNTVGNNPVFSTIRAQSGDISTFTALTVAAATSVAAPIINTQTINTSTLNTQTINTSTLNVSSFALPNALTLSTLNASTINASGIIASTLNVSTFNLPQAFTVSSLNASTVNTSIFTTSTFSVSSFTLPNALTISTLNSSSINSGQGTFSTLAVSSFTLPNNLSVSTIAASSINANNISTNSLSANNMSTNSLNVGTINSLVGNFSTLNAPGGTTTPIVSSIVTVARELFTSTMTFSASLSPNLDLGLGGVIGGLVGGVTANAMGVGLGAAGLATGMSALILSRTSGGLNPAQFQLVNGNTQLQFSTIMAANPGDPIFGKFLETDSAAPLTTPGNLSTISNFLGYGQVYAVRSVSDPLNLPNAAGAAGQAIQSFGEWVKVMPGRLDMAQSTIFNQYIGNYIDFGRTGFEAGNPPPVMTIGNTIYPEGICLTRVKGQFDVTFGISAQSIATPSFQAEETYISTLNAFKFPNFISSLTIIPGLNTSTISVSSITGNRLTANSVSTTTLAASGAVNVGTNLFVTNNANITNTLTATNVNLTSINGVPYSPVTAGTPTGSLMMWPGGNNTVGPINVPPGYLYCDGAMYAPSLYPALYNAIGNTWGGTPGVSFRVPDTRGRAAFGSLVDSSIGSAFQYSPQVTFQSVTVSGLPVADTNNGWYVTATTSQVYIGMQFNFAGTIGTRTIVKILSNNGIGDGWVTPFVIVWNNDGSSKTFPVYAASSQALLQTETSLTIGPFIGRQPSDPGGTYNLQAAMGTPGNGQAIDQTSAHNHGYGLGGAGSPQLVNGNRSGDPTQSFTTGNTNGLYSYTIPGGGGVTVNNIMLNNPPNFGVFYYIKT
jgi:microcystin-dependent protein